jgi:hypothetical protein
MGYPTPSPAQIEAAFKAHGVNYVLVPLKTKAEGRPWSQGLRALIDHHTAGVNSLGYLQNSGGSYPFVNSLIDKNGLVHVLSRLSCWGPGRGGPWTGVAAADSLHLVGWSTEVESLGRIPDFTPQQFESLGRQNAALLSLGIPAANEINHKAWTSCVGGHPVDVAGRKDDTLYHIEILRANTLKYVTAPKPIPKPPVQLAYRQGKKVFSNKMHAGQTNSDSVWNICLSLHAKGYYKGVVVDDYTPDVVAACSKFQHAQGWSGKDANGIAGPETTKRLGCVWVQV